jgi:outer membrane protein
MRKILAVGCLMIMSAVATAQTQGDSSILTFQDALKIALMNNVTLQTQRNNLELSQIQKRSALASLGPNVSLNGQAARIDGNSFNQQQGAVVNGVRDNISGSLNLDINLFNGFGQLNTIRANAAAFDAQSHFVNRTAQDVINTVGTQYLQVLLDVELLRIAKENFDVQTKQSEQIHEFVAAGSRSQVDEYNQDALTKAAELRYVQAEIALTNDLATLTQTLLVDPFETYAVRKPGWDINAIGSEPIDLAQMLATAKAHRGDYLRAAKNEDAQRYGAMAAKSSMLPSLTAFFNYGSGYNYQHDVRDSVEERYRTLVPFTSSPGVTSYAFSDEVSEVVANPNLPRPFSTQFREDNVYKQYGLQLTIPLFRGLRNRVTYVQQRVARDNAQLQTKNAEFLLKNDVLRTAKNFGGVRKAYQVAVAQARAAELAYQYETERYNLGVTNLVEYSTANARYMQAMTDLAQAEYRLLFQKIQLEYSLGTLKIEDLQ